MPERTKRAGVLALQGDFEAHREALRKAGAEVIDVRSASQLQDIDGLILPGGESTTMLKLLDRENLFEPLRTFGATKPIFGTCAGTILLASEVFAPQQRSLNLMDIAVERNGYGRQVDSRIARLRWEGAGDGDAGLEAVFIRAPIIRRLSSDVRVLARLEGQPVLVEQGRHMAATFHPELTGDLRLHQLFLSKL